LKNEKSLNIEKLVKKNEFMIFENALSNKKIFENEKLLAKK
jgi:hypothetical protein